MNNAGKLGAVMAAWELPLPSTEKLVLVCLVQHINAKTGTAWCSVARLVRLTGLSERTVQRAITKLELTGAITRDERAGRTTEYRSTLRRTGPEPVADPRHSDTPPPSQGHPTPVTVTPHPRHSDTRTYIQHEKEHGINTQGASVSVFGSDGFKSLQDELRALYPKRSPVLSWDWAVIQQRLSEGATVDELKAAVRRYATWCDVSAVTGTRYVMFPARFFAAGSDAPWKQPFMLAGGKSSEPLTQDQKAQQSIDKEAHRLGVPGRKADESIEAYSARIRREVISEALEKMAKAKGQGRA